MFPPNTSAMMFRVLLSILVFCTAAAPLHAEDFIDRIAKLEKKSGGKIGVAVLDSANGRLLGYRQDERFAMASTFKVLLVVTVLARVDAGKEQLDRLVPYDKSDLLSYAPVTKQHLAEGKLSVADLCAAAIELSDNSAANLLLENIGGPMAVTHFLRSLGDKTTRLDRNEPSLNSNLPGDERDSSTPAAMTGTLQKLLLGDALSASSRKQLAKWMVACKTGDAKLRAGLPKDWNVGNKTGSGRNGASNDVAIIWPKERPPFLVAVFTTELPGTPEEQSAVVAEVGRIVASIPPPAKPKTACFWRTRQFLRS